MRIAIVTDAWEPQTNGVVVTLQRTARWLERLGNEVGFVTHEGLRTFPMPTYPEIRLAWRPGGHVERQLDGFEPDRIHIATEGPLGLAARAYCLRNALTFTTSYHTRFPQYVRARFPVPETWTYRLLRWFHGPAQRTMVGTESLRRELAGRGFDNVAIWSRGVDTELFSPRDKGFLDAPRPISMYLGRVAVEKNVEAFLELDLPGTQYVVGDGPALEDLRERYPRAVFTGYKYGVELASHLAAADVFVFPSRTDTFGLVLLEAMACGVPVAAYPVTGPVDIVEDGVTGALDEDLGAAVERALRADPAACRRAATKRTWEAASRQFLDNLVEAAEEGSTAVSSFGATH